MGSEGETFWATCTNCPGQVQYWASPAWLLSSSGKCIKKRQYKGYNGITFRHLIIQFYTQEGLRKCYKKNTALFKGRLSKHKGCMVHHMWKEQRLSWHREQTELKPDFLHRWIYHGKSVSSKSGLSIAQSLRLSQGHFNLIRVVIQAMTDKLL